MNKDTPTKGGFRCCYRSSDHILRIRGVRGGVGGVAQAAGQIACSGCSCGEGSTATRAPPANSRTTHRSAPELPTSPGGRGGVSEPPRDLLGGSWAQHRLGAHCRDAPQAQWGCPGGRGPEPATHHLPAPPPSRVSGESLPPATKGRALTRLPTERTRD